jgi:hypothetical protein
VQGDVVLYVGEGAFGLTLMAIWSVDAQIYSQNGWMAALLKRNAADLNQKIIGSWPEAFKTL